MLSMVFTRPELELPRRDTGSPSEGTHEFVRYPTYIVSEEDTADFRVPVGTTSAEDWIMSTRCARAYNVTDISESEDGLVIDGGGEWVSSLQSPDVSRR